MIIDDDEDYLEILKIGLNSEFEILTIGSLQQIETELQGLRPALILLDKHLGAIKTEDVIEAIRSREALKTIPILLMSGSDTGRRASVNHELEGFMVKPASIQEVRDRLHATLNRQHNA